MIPYFELRHIVLGPLTLQVWGLVVAIGILTGTFAAYRYARARNLNPAIISESVTWILIGAFLSARLFHVLFYQPSYFLAHPIEIVAVWQGGLSISGGFLGAIITGIWILKKKGVSIVPYAGAMVFGLPLGSFIGRIGCFLLHLHPGKPTNFFLGVTYPDGIVRHDLGLYLSLNGLVLFVVFFIMSKKKVSETAIIITYLLWYGVTRFFLDFLRASEGPIVDSRYFNLTPAQYISIIMVATGLSIIYFIRNNIGSSFAHRS